MPKLVALDNQVHGHLKVDPTKVEEVGADLHMLPVVITEFQKLVVQYPIVLSKNEQTGRFVCVALMGFEEGENLFWYGGRLDGIYTPLNIARHPFFVGHNQEGNDNYIVCIDEESPCLSELHTQALFDETGEGTAYLHSAQAILAELIQGETQTNRWIQILLKLELLVPLTLDITFENEEIKKIKGLYSIDEDKLNSLSGQTLKKLQDEGALQAIYTQLASLGQIYSLIDKKNQRLSQGSHWFKATGE